MDEKQAPADTVPICKVQIVALAASAGGLAAFMAILGPLPASFPVPILAVMHMDPSHPSLLAGLLDRRTRLKVCEAQDGMRLSPGTVFVAPPNHHLLANRKGEVTLTQTDRVHFLRPAADELFFSVAEIYGAAALGVLCTGGGVDGSAGLHAIHERGGFTIVQDPATCTSSSMPAQAVRLGAASLVLPLHEIAERLQKIVADH